MLFLKIYDALIAISHIVSIWIQIEIYISSKLQSDYAMFGNTRQCLLCGGSACKPVWSTLKRVVWYFEDGRFLICKAIYYKVILIGRSLAYILKCSIADQYKIVLYTTIHAFCFTARYLLNRVLIWLI